MEFRVASKYSEFADMELLRCDVFGLEKSISPYYEDRFENHKTFFLGAYENNQLVGALYFSPFLYNTGIIDMLFVRKDYQDTDLHIGSALLAYIEIHNEDICDYFNYLSIDKYLISPASEKSERLYKHRGYRKTGLDGTFYKRMN